MVLTNQSLKLIVYTLPSNRLLPHKALSHLCISVPVFYFMRKSRFLPFCTKPIQILPIVYGVSPWESFLISVCQSLSKCSTESLDDTTQHFVFLQLWLAHRTYFHKPYLKILQSSGTHPQNADAESSNYPRIVSQQK